MNRNTLTERQVFYIAEFQEEAAWLSFMHREGWKMTRTTGFKYYFEACPQEDWAYQLDFKEEGVDEEAYIQMYADYGWEFVTRFRRWYLGLLEQGIYTAPSQFEAMFLCNAHTDAEIQRIIDCAGRIF